MWSQPVSLTLGDPPRRRFVTTVAEAVECLERWPEDGRGHRYHAAVAVCRGALEGNTKPEAARQALIEAAKEAAILG